MEDNNKNYTVMELAELIGVPRTTINDWLNRYGQYILSIPQGKRKVYPESAVRVLQEVASLRNQAKSFAQIEKILSETCPIRAEFVLPEQSAERGVEPEKAEKSSTSGSALVGEAVPLQEKMASEVENEFAVIARRQSEEITRMIGESFRNMDERIRELEGIARTRKKMSCFWFGAFLVFLLLLGGVCWGAWHFLNKSAAERQILVRKQEEKNKTIAALREQSVTLIAESRNYRENVLRLQKELHSQQKQFEASIRTQRKDLQELNKAREQSLEARWKQTLAQQQIREAQAKERFAAERLRLLQRMDAMEKKHQADLRRMDAMKKKHQMELRKLEDAQLRKDGIQKKVLLPAEKKAPAAKQEGSPAKTKTEKTVSLSDNK